jgi:probable addiction module antidote protein
MRNKTRPYREVLLQSLTNPHTAAAYLSAAHDDSPEMFRKALRNVAQSRQMSKVAKGAGITRESLYQATSEIGNPTLDTLDSVLDVLDLKLAVVPKDSETFAQTKASSSQTPNIVSSREDKSEAASMGLTGLFWPGSNAATSSVYGAPMPEPKPIILSVHEEQEQGLTVKDFVGEIGCSDTLVILPGFLQQQTLLTERSNVES